MIFAFSVVGRLPSSAPGVILDDAPLQVPILVLSCSMKEHVMRRGIAVLLLLLALPGLARAQEPEDLLPAGTQLYLRWDGVEAHRAAYDKSALGKMLKGDTGRFVNGIFTTLQETLGSQLTGEQLQAGAPPDRLEKLQADAAEAPKLFQLLSQHGLVLALQVRQLEPPQGQLTLFVPNAGEKAKPL